MGLKPLPVDLKELASALDEAVSRSTTAYLDRETGDLEWVPTPQDVELETNEFDEILRSPHRWLKVGVAPAWVRLEVRRQFVETVDDPQLRLRLADALDAGSAALGRFGRLLREQPDLGDAWLSFRDRVLEAAAREWLASAGLRPM